MSSHVAVKLKKHQINQQGYQQCLKARQPEVQARFTAPPQLTPLDLHILRLEAIGMNPRCFPAYQIGERPTRPIGGKALWGWIGRRIGWTAKMVEVHLDSLSKNMV